jgi:hypothetical protein
VDGGEEGQRSLAEAGGGEGWNGRGGARGPGSTGKGGGCHAEERSEDQEEP